MRENEISVWETPGFIQFSPEGSKVRLFNEMIRSPAVAATVTEEARSRSEATRRAALSSVWLREEHVDLIIMMVGYRRFIKLNDMLVGIRP